MEEIGIIINDRSKDGLICEVCNPDEVSETVREAANFFEAMGMNVQILVGPMDQLLEILEQHGIELQPLEKQNSNTTEN